MMSDEKSAVERLEQWLDRRDAEIRCGEERSTKLIQTEVDGARAALEVVKGELAALESDNEEMQGRIAYAISYSAQNKDSDLIVTEMLHALIDMDVEQQRREDNR